MSLSLSQFPQPALPSAHWLIAPLAEDLHRELIDRKHREWSSWSNCFAAPDLDPEVVAFQVRSSWCLPNQSRARLEAVCRPIDPRLTEAVKNLFDQIGALFKNCGVAAEDWNHCSYTKWAEPFTVQPILQERMDRLLKLFGADAAQLEMDVHPRALAFINRGGIRKKGTYKYVEPSVILDGEHMVVCSGLCRMAEISVKENQKPSCSDQEQTSTEGSSRAPATAQPRQAVVGPQVLFEDEIRKLRFLLRAADEATPPSSATCSAISMGSCSTQPAVTPSESSAQLPSLGALAVGPCMDSIIDREVRHFCFMETALIDGVSYATSLQTRATEHASWWYPAQAWTLVNRWAAVRYARDLLEQLNYLAVHKKSHGDIKTANTLLSDAGEAFLVDAMSVRSIEENYWPECTWEYCHPLALQASADCHTRPLPQTPANMAPALGLWTRVNRSTCKPRIIQTIPSEVQRQHPQPSFVDGFSMTANLPIESQDRWQWRQRFDLWSWGITALEALSAAEGLRGHWPVFSKLSIYLEYKDRHKFDPFLYRDLYLNPLLALNSQMQSFVDPLTAEFCALIPQVLDPTPRQIALATLSKSVNNILNRYIPSVTRMDELSEQPSYVFPYEHPDARTPLPLTLPEGWAL
ncbi:MAG: hypothetical protein ACOYKZ_05530 [Chlamydiia bacterium]